MNDARIARFSRQSNFFLSASLFLALQLALFLGLPTASAEQPPNIPAQRTNIVVIMADDMGIGDPGCYNPDSKIPTPNIDAIAAAGMRFTDAHSPSAVCTPTRYGVLTGRYAWRTRMKSGVLWGYSRSLIEPDRLTVASLLRRQGYRTACVGKWHLGFQSIHVSENGKLVDQTDKKVDYAQPLSPGPTTVGFDYFFGIPASLDMEPYLYVENDRPLLQPTEVMHGSKNRRDGGGGFWRAGPASPDFKHVEVLPKLADKAAEWIGRQTADHPFFLYFPLSAPHKPWMPSPEFQGKSQAGYYGDFAAQVDTVVGRVLTALDERGLADNTLLIFTSDNGAQWIGQDEQKYHHWANLKYRGQKADIWEGGHRVPFVVRWPAQTKPGTTCDQTICLTDLTATAAAISGADMKADAGEDSFDFSPLLNGESTGKRQSIIHHSANGTFAIRNGRWKLIDGNLGSGGFSSPKKVKPKANGPQGQLYDLNADPYETTNLYENEPDVVARLTAELDQIRESGRSRVVLQ